MTPSYLLLLAHTVISLFLYSNKTVNVFFGVMMNQYQGLVDQIDKYSNKSSLRDEQRAQDTAFANARLGETGITALHDGILDYQSGYEDLIRKKYPSEDVGQNDMPIRKVYVV